MTKIPKYWSKAKRYLSKKDRTMSKLIQNYKSPSETILTSRKDIFFFFMQKHYRATNKCCCSKFSFFKIQKKM